MIDWIKKVFTAIDHFDRKYGEWLFYAALVLDFLSISWLCSNQLPTFPFWPKWTYKAMFWLCYGRIGLLVVRNWRYALLCLAALMVLRVSWHHSGDWGFYVLGLLITASYGADIKRTLRILGVLFVGNILLGVSLFHLEYASELQTHSMGLTGHSWGICNPNSLAYFLLLIVEIVLLLSRVQYSRWMWAVCWISALLIWYLTLCNTVCLLLVSLPVLYWALSRSRIPAWATASAPWVLFLLSMVLMFVYGPTTGDTNFASRFGMGAIAYRDYGLTWLGQNCGHISYSKAVELGVEPFFLDCFYLRSLFYYGLLPTLIVLATESYLLFTLTRTRCWMALAITLLTLIGGLMEVYPLFYYWHFTLIYIAAKGVGQLEESSTTR